MIYRLMPGLYHLVHYKSSYLTGDITSAIIVTFLLIPQSMAYAMIAGVPIVLGLFAATFPLIVYALVGTSRYLSVGPLSIIALLSFSGVAKITGADSSQFLNTMIILTFFVGIIQLILGFIKFGSFIEYISSSVMKGFVSAAALIIAITQIQSVFGIQIPPYQQFLSYMSYILKQLPHYHEYTTIIGIGSLFILLIIKRVFKSLLGPVLVIFITIIVVDLFDLQQKGVRVIGEIPRGLPEVVFILPTFELMVQLFPAAFMIAFIGFAESYAIGKTLAEKEQMTIQPNQELFGLGLANLTSSFVGAFPVSGAISRTAVNYQSGAKSNASLLFTAIMMLIVTLYLIPLFYHLPHATLGAIIILAVLNLIDIKALHGYIRHEPIHAMLFLTTMLLTLLIDMFFGLIVGIFLSLLINLIKHKLIRFT